FTATLYSNIAAYVLQQPTLQEFDQMPKDETLYQHKNLGSSSLEVEETDVGGLTASIEEVVRRRNRKNSNPAYVVIIFLSLF
ncbi:hypothetical protein A2U01_0051831, partial [Trifolium medium]|nr:hypothetical protein [Trifolium medium]